MTILGMMMKTNSALITGILVLCFANCFGQFVNDRYTLNTTSVLKGNVDSVVVIEALDDNSKGKIKLDTIFKLGYIYNGAKQLTGSYVYSWVEVYNRARAGVKPSRTIYLYDDVGNLFEMRQYDTHGNSWGKWTYLRKDRIVEVQEYDHGDNSLIPTDTIKINTRDEMIERYSYTKRAELFSRIYFKYNENGEVTEEAAYSSDGSLMHKDRWKYNKAGDVIEGDEDGVYTYTYEKYDKMQNWLIKTEYVNGSPSKLISRKIYYHK